jgi:hypothetical protein
MVVQNNEREQPSGARQATQLRWRDMSPTTTLAQLRKPSQVQPTSLGHFLLLGSGMGISATSSGIFPVRGWSIEVSATTLGHFLLFGSGIGISAALTNILPAEPIIIKDVNKSLFITLLFGDLGHVFP